MKFSPHLLKKAWWSGSLLILILTNCYVAKALPLDTALTNQISQMLHSKNQLPLYFPRSVKRFYAARQNQPVWLIREKGETGHTWQAMLLLDCVLQYGLSHADYHPDELRYDLLHELLEQPDNISQERQARFELMLTDAMLSLMNHLHYGKLNPELPASSIDKGHGDMRADLVLRKALSHVEFSETLLSVQPHVQAYKDMQYWMQKWKGQYQEDCYEIPEASVRKVAVNMERLRWAAIGTGPYIQINIPSYTLKLSLPNKTYHFKIVAGKKATPTPLLQSNIYAINLLPTAITPDRGTAISLGKGPSVYNFPFINRHHIGLQEIKQTSWFKHSNRAMSKGSIGVENADKLAELLLKVDHQRQKIQLLRQTRLSGKAASVKLRSPMPLNVTYVSCWFKDGQLMTYPDIYQLDSKLERALYHQLPDKLTNR